MKVIEQKQWYDNNLTSISDSSDVYHLINLMIEIKLLPWIKAIELDNLKNRKNYRI